MRIIRTVLVSIIVIVLLGLPAFGQSGAEGETAPGAAPTQKDKKTKGPGKAMASGGADVGKGAAKGAVDLGKGAAGGAADLATGHPIDATVSVGKGAVGAGGHVGVGAVKGSVKMGRGIGRLVHRHRKRTRDE